MPEPPAAIQTDQLTHRYPKRDRDALHALTMSVAAGEIFGVLGPNGSGKTTLFRILSTMLRPTSGSAAIAGCDVLRDQAGARRALGVVFQSPSLDEILTPLENIVCQAALYGLPAREAKQQGERWLKLLSISDLTDRRVKTLSGGQRRRVEVAKALVHQPRVLLLDEPATGMDPAARRELWRHLNNLRRETGITIAVTTHLMDEAEHCDRLAVFNEGKLAALDTPAALKAMIGGHVITVEPKLVGEPDAVTQHLAEQITARFGPWPNGTRPQAVEGKVVFEHADGPATVAAVAAALPDQVRAITFGQPTLEDVFLHLTGATLHDVATEDKHPGIPGAM